MEFPLGGQDGKQQHPLRLAIENVDKDNEGGIVGNRRAWIKAFTFQPSKDKKQQKQVCDKSHAKFGTTNLFLTWKDNKITDMQTV